MLQFAALPAERMRGARLVDDFRDALTVARNGWMAFNAPIYAQNGGVNLNGTTQYLTRPLTGQLNSPSLTFHIEFWPTFAAAEVASRRFLSASATFDVYRSSSGLLAITAGGAVILASAFATWGSLWLVGRRNLLSFSITNGAQTLWLNGVQIATNTAAYTPINEAALIVGAHPAPTSYFAGTITRLYIGHHTSTLAEHQAYYNEDMFNWRNRATVALQLRMQDYDPTNVRTLDSSGHANHFTLGDGATAATFPTQGNGRMTFDGGDYLDAGDKEAFEFGDGAGNDRPFTLFFLLSPYLISADETLLSKMNTATTREFRCYIANNGTFVLQIFSLVSGDRIGKAAPLGTIIRGLTQTIAAVYNGSKTSDWISLWRNGLSITTADISAGNYVGVTPTAIPAILGAYISGAVKTAFYTGSIKGFSLLPFAANQTQIIDYHIQAMRRIGSET